MLFFALMIAIALGAGCVLWLAGVPDLAASMRWGMSLALLLAGADHLKNPQRYLPMMPAFLPLHGVLVAFTGVCEIAGGLGLLVPPVRWLAGVMLAVYFVCVFPANVNVALTGGRVEGMPQAHWYYWVRLLFQPLVVWWALFAAEVIR
jgi:uncharacterized membrane protein